MKLTKIDLFRLIYLIALIGGSIVTIIGADRLAERSRRTNEFVERHVESMRAGGVYSQLSENDQEYVYDMSSAAHFASIVSSEMKYYTAIVLTLWVLFSLVEIVKTISRIAIGRGVQ